MAVKKIGLILNRDFVKNIFSSSSKLSSLSSLVLKKEFKADEIPCVKEYKCVKEFLDLPLNHQKEQQLKKVLAASVIAANEKKVLPFKIEAKPHVISSAIDDGLSRFKVAYKVGQNLMNPIKAAEYMVERGISRVASVVKKTANVFIDNALPVVLKGLSKVLICNPVTAPIAPIVHFASKFVAPAVKHVVSKGVDFVAKKVAPVVKETCSAVWEGAKAVGRKVSSYVKSLFIWF